jgi:copper chaperone CopZ
MNRRTACTLMGAAVGSLFLVGPVSAANPKPISISIKDMHCTVCAKKISDQLKTVGGVQAVKTDFKSGTAVVTPHASKSPSPKALWEAVERAGFKPTRLVGPGGTYSAKPKV